MLNSGLNSAEFRRIVDDDYRRAKRYEFNRRVERILREFDCGGINPDDITVIVREWNEARMRKERKNTKKRGKAK